MEYFPLSEERNEFRLARLEPKSFKPTSGHTSQTTVVNCTVEHTFRGSEGLSYKALSYAWGDESDRRLIHVDGKPVSIGANLESALQHLADQTEDILLSIDQICIN